MLRTTLFLAGCALAAWALPMEAELPEPGHLAMILNEEDFEDYLDKWLELEQNNGFERARNVQSGNDGCTIRVNGDLGQPQPVYLKDGDYLDPTAATGSIHLNSGEEVVISCPGSGRRIVHSNLFNSAVATAGLYFGRRVKCGLVDASDQLTDKNQTTSLAGIVARPNFQPKTATCVNDARFAGNGWLNGNGEFLGFTCSSHAFHNAEYTGETCYGGNRVIRVGFIVDDEFLPLYWSCFDSNRLEVLYVWYEQRPQNAIHQTSVSRPSWLPGSFYPGVAVNTQYTQARQLLTIAELVGSDELARKYVTSTQFLARGHLSAKTDFIYATGQRSTFYFINAAPQWQPFNAGNWNWLEQNLRARIGAAGYETVVYTGTWGVTQLRNVDDRLVDIYLHTDANNNPQLPVPLYYYKVVYDESRQIGTAFVSINNPYYTEEEVRELTFCTDRCRNNSAFDWVRWQIDNISLGYSFCCEIDDFRRTVLHLPAFEPVNGLLA